MRSLHLIVAIVVLCAASSFQAQEPLSSEPGGQEACSKALAVWIKKSDPPAKSLNAACHARDLKIEQARLQALSKAEETSPPARRVAFNSLLVALTTFREAHALHEDCFTGSSCPDSRVVAELQVDQDFLGMIAPSEPSQLPQFSNEDLVKADAALNETYQTRLDSLSPACQPGQDSCLSQGVFRDVQRDWIRYRDAWMAYAALRWPNIAGVRWQTLLTRARIEQIEAMPESDGTP